MSAAPQAATAAAATPAVELSAAQQLTRSAEALWADLTRLTAEQFALNLALSVAVMVSAAVVIWLLRRALNAGLERMASRGLVRADEADGKPRVARWTWLMLRLAVLAAAAVMVLSVWGLDLITWLTAGSGAALTRVVLVLLVAAALVEVVGHVVTRVTRRFEGRAKDPRRGQQVKTLAPLLRGLAQGFIIVVAGLTLLSELGVQIGPLLASAGVVGVAVGFGAQTLVKDVLTGFFLVLEDIVGVGDNVSIGDNQGTVEAMTLRTIRLRSMNGTLHVFPYSEAQVIHNHTKTFSAYLFEFGIGYGDDIDEAVAVLEREGEALKAEPEWADVILEPLEIFGVDKLGDSAVVLKARFRTKPGQQWKVGREFNRRVKLAFDRAGIEIPFPYTKIVFDQGGGEPANANAAAASRPWRGPAAEETAPEAAE